MKRGKGRRQEFVSWGNLTRRHSSLSNEKREGRSPPFADSKLEHQASREPSIERLLIPGVSGPRTVDVPVLNFQEVRVRSCGAGAPIKLIEERNRSGIGDIEQVGSHSERVPLRNLERLLHVRIDAARNRGASLNTTDP